MKRQPRRSSAPAVFTAGKGLNTAGKKWSEPKIPVLVKTGVFLGSIQQKKNISEISIFTHRKRVKSKILALMCFYRSNGVEQGTQI